MSNAKEAIRRLIEMLDKGGKIEWARTSRFLQNPDGSIRRLILSTDAPSDRRKAP